MPSLPPAIDLEVHRTGRGEPLVALHDMGRDGTTMQRALRDLRRKHTIIAPDLRGHGASPSPKGPWSIDDFSSDVARIIQDEGPPATLVGVGLGAAAALALALGHPSLVPELTASWQSRVALSTPGVVYRGRCRRRLIGSEGWGEQ